MTTKPAYQFNHAGLLVGTTQADECQLEPGVFLLPGRCTFVAPPDDVPADKWPRWNGTEWHLANRPKQADQEAPDPVAKLQAFLAEHPDVAELIGAA